MGRAKRERRERIKAGLEESFSQRREREYREQLKREKEAFNALPITEQDRILKSRARADLAIEAIARVLRF